MRRGTIVRRRHRQSASQPAHAAARRRRSVSVAVGQTGDLVDLPHTPVELAAAAGQ